MSKIIIGADLVPTERNKQLFIENNIEKLFGLELLNILNDAEYKIFNLEVPLTDVYTPIDKCGPALIANTQTINAYKAIGVNLLTLANNHILDQGIQGLDSTIKVLQENGIEYVGVGNKETASQPFFFEFYNKKIGVYACVEHEFSTVEDFEKGANPFDVIESFDHISNTKKECDYLIVLYHGGKEHYRYPSPNLQKVCRKMVERGADLIICQHSHCIGCKEEYKNGTIVYGQGNFLFDSSEMDCWQTSLLVSINQNFKVEYLPLIKQKEVVRLASEQKGKEILNDFFKRSEQIKEKGFIENEYAEFSKKMIENYLFSFSGIKYGFFSKVFNKFTHGKFLPWRIKKKLSKKKLLAIRNYIECEAHRELMIKGLKKFYE